MRGTMRTQPPVSLALPSLASLEENDERRLSAELSLARLRAQVAVIRTLTDHIEQFAHAADVAGLHEQVVEEVARLGCRLFEVAASMAASDRPEVSGVFRRVDPLPAADSRGPATS
jgi:type II secretory pathway component PulM